MRLWLAEGDYNSSGDDEHTAESLAPGEALSQEQRGEDDYEGYAEFIDRRDARGRAELQRPEIAQPGEARCESRKRQEQPCFIRWNMKRAGLTGDVGN